MKLYLYLFLVLCCVTRTLQSPNSFISLPAIKQRAAVSERDTSSLPRVRRSLSVSEFEKTTDFWYATNFTVGDGRDFTLLIDTGSSDILLNKGV